MTRNQSGFAHILSILILLAGIGIAVYLTQFTQIFKPKANSDEASQPGLIQGEIDSNIHQFSNWGGHIQKMQTIGKWTYAVSTIYTTGVNPPTDPKDINSAYWVITKSSDGVVWSREVSHLVPSATQPPSLLKTKDNHLIVIFNGLNAKGLYFNEYSVDLAEGTLTSLLSNDLVIVPDTFLASYVGAGIDPETSNIVILYWNTTHNNYLVKRINGVWNTSGVLPGELLFQEDINGLKQVVVYPYVVWANGKVHIVYMHARHGGAPYNYHAIRHIQSSDYGQTWTNISGASINIPITISASENGPDLISQLPNSPLQVIESVSSDKYGNVHIKYLDAWNANGASTLVDRVSYPASPFAGSYEKSWYVRINADGTKSGYQEVPDYSSMVVDNSADPPVLFNVRALPDSSGVTNLRFWYKPVIQAYDNEWQELPDKYPLSAWPSYQNGNVWVRHYGGFAVQRDVVDHKLKLLFEFLSTNDSSIYSCNPTRYHGQLFYCEAGSVFIDTPSPTLNPSPSTSPSPSPKPSVTSNSSPVPTPAASVTANVNVTRMEKLKLLQGAVPFYDTFYTTNQSEIDNLTKQKYVNKGVAFKTPASGASEVVMVNRMVKKILLTGENFVQVTTWATDTTDKNNLKSQGFSETSGNDFYVYPTQQPNTIGVTRLKIYSQEDNKTFYTFATSQTITNSLINQGWQVDKANVFYVYP